MSLNRAAIAGVTVAVAAVLWIGLRHGVAPIVSQVSAAVPQRTYDVTYLCVAGLTDPGAKAPDGKAVVLPTSQLFLDAEKAPVTGDGRDYARNLQGLAPGIHLKPVLVLHGILDADDPLRLQGGPISDGIARTKTSIYLRSAMGIHSDTWQETSRLPADQRRALLQTEEQSLQANGQVQVRLTLSRSTFFKAGVGETASHFPVGPHENAAAVQQTVPIGQSYVLGSGTMSDPDRADRNYCLIDVLCIKPRG